MVTGKVRIQLFPGVWRLLVLLKLRYSSFDVAYLGKIVRMATLLPLHLASKLLACNMQTSCRSCSTGYCTPPLVNLAKKLSHQRLIYAVYLMWFWNVLG